MKDLLFLEVKKNNFHSLGFKEIESADLCPEISGSFSHMVRCLAVAMSSSHRISALTLFTHTSCSRRSQWGLQCRSQSKPRLKQHINLTGDVSKLLPL